MMPMLSSTGLGNKGGTELAVRCKAREAAPLGVEEGQIPRFAAGALCHLSEDAAVHLLPDVRLEGHVVLQKFVDLVEVALIGAVELFDEVFAVLDAVAEHDVGGGSDGC